MPLAVSFDTLRFEEKILSAFLANCQDKCFA